VRQQAYQAVLSGASGHVIGNETIWRYASGWQTALNSAGSSTIRYLRTLLEAHEWWRLQPDAGSTFLTAGGSSGADQAATALADDGSFGLIYAPSQRALTVNLGKLTGGAHVVARWYAASTGAYTTITGSPFVASGSQTLTPPSSGDWVLVLEAAP
jgi:hypothetical protein